jgi:hypothetical protein
MAMPTPDREGHAEKAIQMLQAALRKDPNVQSLPDVNGQDPGRGRVRREFARDSRDGSDVPAPTARILYWRSQPEAKRDREAIRAFAFHLGLTLKRYCQIF